MPRAKSQRVEDTPEAPQVSRAVPQAFPQSAKKCEAWLLMPRGSVEKADVIALRESYVQCVACLSTDVRRCRLSCVSRAMCGAHVCVG